MKIGYAVAIILAILVIFMGGFFLGKQSRIETRMELAQISAHEMQMEMPQYKIEAMNIPNQGPNIMIRHPDESNAYPNMVARIEIGMGGEYYPIYWNEDEATHVYHWNKQESLEQIIERLNGRPIN